MNLDLYVVDPWGLDSANAPEAYLAQLLAHCPELARGDWALRPTIPANVFTQAHLQSKAHLTAALLKPAQVQAAFCVLPVHLSMQRDSFSLQAILSLSEPVFSALTDTLSQHFAQDFHCVADLEQRCWWIMPKTDMQVESPWPQDCMFQTAMAWQPKGSDSRLLRRWSNEAQMLLHQLAAQPPLADWPPMLNSLWFASVSPMTTDMHASIHLAGNGRIFDALARSHRSIVDLRQMTQRYASLVYVADQLHTVNWVPIRQWLNDGRVTTLRMIFPFAERHVEVIWQRRMRWQFWRKTKNKEALLGQLSSALLQASRLQPSELIYENPSA